MSLLQLALLGAVIGAPLGYALQRTRLCFNSAYRQVLLKRDATLLRAIVLAVVVQMAGLHAMAQLGAGGVQVNVVPFFPIANVIGGFVFGVAMVYAEGCSSTVWYRVGNGNLGALVTLIAFAIGEALTEVVFLAPLREAMQAGQIAPADGPALSLALSAVEGAAEGSLATAPNFLGVTPWLVVVPIVALALAWLWRAKDSRYLGGWGWRRAGLILGILGALAWLVAWPTGWRYGVGVVGAAGPWVRAPFEGAGLLNWGSFMLLAMPLGALIAALRYREFRWQVPNLPGAARMATAGLIMGISATIAGGCNIGHGFTGVPALALSSLVATLFTFLGAAIGNYARFARSRRVALRAN